MKNTNVVQSKVKSISIYKKTYEKYLKQLSSDRVRSRIKRNPGILIDDMKIKIRMLQENYEIAESKMLDEAGNVPSIEKCVVLAKYLLSDSNTLSEGNKLVSFSSIKEAGPLAHYFYQNVEKPISDEYSADYKKLEKACFSNGALKPIVKLPYDFTVQFVAMPQIAIYLLFNFADREFTANCKIMFEKKATYYLDPECLAILATLLSEKIVGPRRRYLKN